MTTSERSPQKNRRVVWLAVAAAGVLGLLGLGLVASRGSSDGDVGPAVDDGADVTVVDEEPVEPRTPLEIVEQRHDAITSRDLAAIHVDVADEVTYCLHFPAGVESPDDCQESLTTYHAQNGWGDEDEQLALRAYAYGGEVLFNCEQEQSSVTCSRVETHLLAQAAEVELQTNTVVYDIEGDEIVSINVFPDSRGLGLGLTAVQGQEAAYGRWLEEEFPADHEDLFVITKPIITSDTADRHRELIAQWLSAGS